MPLGTLDRSPPPFFRQGPSALTKLAVLSALAIFLMVADRRFAIVEPLRAGIATALLPVQQALAWPVDIALNATAYLQALDSALASERQAQLALARQAEAGAKVLALTAENERLRALLAISPALQTRSLAAEVMYAARDPYSHRIVIDRGATQGVRLGAPVIHEGGVLGQVTRVYPLSAEVSLLVDKDAAIPVLNPRTQVRGAAFGGATGPDGPALELRFVSANADLQIGDELQTSGLDGVYPPGLAVARVLSVERRSQSGYANVLLAPAATTGDLRHVLVLEPLELQRPPRPGTPASGAAP